MNISLDDIDFYKEDDNTKEELDECMTIGMDFESVDEVKSFYRQYAISKVLVFEQEVQVRTRTMDYVTL